MHDHAAHRNQYPSAQFQQPFAECPDLSACTVGARGPQAQLLHQHVSGGGQQHPELVGPEIAATGAVDLQVDRTSCSDFWVNQFRVLLTAAAYVLMQELRLRAARTNCARAQVWTLRERLLKL